MLNLSRQLTELVRLLQERGYIFAADPLPVTEALHDVAGGAEEKLNRRAEMIDSDGRLNDSLVSVAGTLNGLLLGLTVMWLVIGFVGTFTLMQQSGLNFFFVLASVLGLNTVMFLVWLVLTFMPHSKGSGGWLRNPGWWIRGKDPVNQAILRLYHDEWNKPSTRWLIGKTSHRFWLATLSGMLAAIVLLLSVRQYTFNWESTLLSGDSFTRAVEWLGWLPGKLGFPVPDADAVLRSRLNQDMASARQWGGLLIGSIVCYGYLPRALAWLLCHAVAKKINTPLPLALPYYQQILQQWQKRVVDADIHQDADAVAKPKVSVDFQAQKWALMLEREWPDAAWHRHVLGQNWLDKGTAADRDTLAAIQGELQQQSVQLLLGIRAQTVPDRGLLRQISRLAEAATGGAVVQLLAQPSAEQLPDYLAQWHSALSELSLAWMDPPRYTQQERAQHS